jgi:hypothetical protein
MQRPARASPILLSRADAKSRDLHSGAAEGSSLDFRYTDLGSVGTRLNGE